MNILTSIFKARDKPKNATSGSSFRFFLGGSTAGKSVTERSAMQMTAVYSCVRILAEAIAGLPLHLYRYNGEGDRQLYMPAQKPQLHGIAVGFIYLHQHVKKIAQNMSRIHAGVDHANVLRF